MVLGAGHENYHSQERGQQHSLSMVLLGPVVVVVVVVPLLSTDHFRLLFFMITLWAARAHQYCRSCANGRVCVPLNPLLLV